ncbi:plant invertase/pectin methylesterase inhibitor [Striga asiatica]|uniref:Pectinesterase n=1 Tax=Striga asiatica TaxID=4170 RepID=A0A5A7QKP7_STRAF|nr:plant invertase/pectin methylesterase inhibitor [Striga asiatica]
MDTVRSFKGYGKVDEVEQAAFRRKTRKRIIILSISSVLLLALIIGVVAGTVSRNKKTSDPGESPASRATAAAVRSICSATRYQSSCLSTLSSANSTNPEKIFELSLTVVLNSLQKISEFPGEYAARTDDPRVREALSVCGTVLSDAVDHLNDSIAAARGGGGGIEDLKTWLSTAVTDQETCADSLREAGAAFAGEAEVLMRNSTELASNSLAIVSRIIGAIDVPIHRRRRMLGVAPPEMDMPAWVDRRLLQQAAVRPDVTVAADGSGDVRTVGEAVERIPKKSKARFVIYVKAGVYVENVVLDKSCWNVMIYGDGKNATIISGSKNFVDGTPTFSTATFVPDYGLQFGLNPPIPSPDPKHLRLITFYSISNSPAVAGRGFIARDIGFKNTAGPNKHQAVAFRSGSDQSVFYRCTFDAFQDTLYAHSNRQFYRECDITGTIDFIFGNSAVVFQNCNILPRQPLTNQFVTITAQGKKDPNQNTGISIQRCAISPLDNLSAPTYLGRPWKDYSTTVIMETSIGGFLNPRGWISWVSNVDPPSSIFYGEYRNTGLGANTANRVSWAGYKASMTASEASKYNVDSFIEGRSWLPATTVKFDST